MGPTSSTNSGAATPQSSSSGPPPVATPTASGGLGAAASGPVIRLGVTNWTRIDASGKGCGAKWGGLGGGDTDTRLRFFEVPLSGDEESWAETFRYTTFEAGGDILHGDIPDWPGWNDSHAEVTNKISETYRVSGLPTPAPGGLIAVPHLPVGKAGQECRHRDRVLESAVRPEARSSHGELYQRLQ